MGRKPFLVPLGAWWLVLSISVTACGKQIDVTPEQWLDAFKFVPVESGEVKPNSCEYSGDFKFTVRTDTLGKQFVRVSITLPYGFVEENETVLLKNANGELIKSDFRVLTSYGGKPKYVRSVIISFVDEFGSGTKDYYLAKGVKESFTKETESPSEILIGEHKFSFDGNRLIVYTSDRKLDIYPFVNVEGVGSEKVFSEVVESGEFYKWVRWFVWDKKFPRVLELRANSLGQFAVKLSVQRIDEEDGYTPEFGISIEGDGDISYVDGDKVVKVSDSFSRDFSNEAKRTQFVTSSIIIGFPDAHCWAKGEVVAKINEVGKWLVDYYRSREKDKVPHQPMAWRTSCVYVGPVGLPMWDELFEGTARIIEHVEDYKMLGTEKFALPKNEILKKCLEWHRNAMRVARLYGDDFGNICSLPQNSVFGMNRLNHNTEIYREYLRTGDAEIRKTFLLWCQNFAQLSIWWGDYGTDEFGGTRYNNITASDPSKHAEDKTFMWRSNYSVSFCTKGFANFLFAYEETGDPMYATALKWQTEYAKKIIHANTGECRNIGIVDDFMILYAVLGKEEYMQEGLRLFRELREKLNDDYLFSQGGQPILKEVPFIDDAKTGYKNPFAKPYIIGYALQGLPQLYELCPEEPKLYETIEAVAKFLADTVDPSGGWRYPHPKSSRVLISQGIEHAHQIMNACKVMKGKSQYYDNCIDAIEKVLQARVVGLMYRNSILSVLKSWEYSAGLVKSGENLEKIYRRFEEKDYSRDYTEGEISFGNSAPPEGIVYFASVLDFYLRERSAERLLAPSTPELKTLLARVLYQKVENETVKECSIEKGLPLFTSEWLHDLIPSLRFNPIKFADFSKWRETARKAVIESLGTPPPFEFFNPVLLKEEDRGKYVARKIAINISTWERIPAYLLIPKGTPPFPAVVCLHDHGGHFSIGKEKVVMPISEKESVVRDAKDWVDKYYGGRFIGDELAQRGYVVLAIDALFWGSRQECEGSKYENQQKVASNIFHLGTTWLGIITWDDIRSVEFLASLPEVDPNRIGAIGLSMGAHRTWILSALCDHIKVGCAICWMATTKSLMVPDNNQTRGQSAYSMLAPNLTTILDIPDVASIACPKPMLFFNGRYDTLFPIEGVEECYKIMKNVWESQNREDYLYTKIWDLEHLFSVEMQEEAFAWLDKFLKR